MTKINLVEKFNELKKSLCKLKEEKGEEMGSDIFYERSKQKLLEKYFLEMPNESILSLTGSSSLVHKIVVSPDGRSLEEWLSLKEPRSISTYYFHKEKAKTKAILEDEDRSFSKEKAKLEEKQKKCKEAIQSLKS